MNALIIILVIIAMVAILLRTFKKEKEEITKVENSTEVQPVKKVNSLRRAMKNAGKKYASTKGFNHVI